MNHLCYANKPDSEQMATLIEIVRASPVLMATFRTAHELDLPDWWIVAGGIYNQVWNHLTDRPDMHGVNDIDMFYFDPDTSYGAEDAVIKRAAGRFAKRPPIEIRNQARVHLWYQDHFGTPYSQLKNCREAIDRFACKTHCIGLRLGLEGEFECYAPYGLNDIFSFRVAPNTQSDNRKTHELKSARQCKIWPELEIIPWPN